MMMMMMRKYDEDETEGHQQWPHCDIIYVTDNYGDDTGEY